MTVSNFRDLLLPQYITEEDLPLDRMVRLSRADGGLNFIRRESISYLVATIGRASLAQTLQSIDLSPGDEILVYQRNPPGRSWGHTERNEMMPFARNAWLAFMDDDDHYLPGYRAAFTHTIRTLPGGRDVPVIFRMRFLNGETTWKKQDITCGTVGTPMFLIPNVPSMLAKFNPEHHFGDFDFLNCLKWPRRNYQYRTDVIAQVGNNPRPGQTVSVLQ